MNKPAEKSFHLAKACHSTGVRDVFIAPGSRNAPLTIAFVRSGKFNIHIVSDERCAGYMAVGSSQGGKRPSAVITTSGTAAVNLYPATVEAFYQQIPLILITADRPPDLIDQLDGQAIRQVSLFKNHIKGDLSIPMNEKPEISGEKAFSLIMSALEGNKGPVHINVPFAEPLYKVLESYEFDAEQTPESGSKPAAHPVDIQALFNSIPKAEKILIIAGQGDPGESILELLKKLSAKNCVIIGDIISNIHEIDNTIRFTEMLIPSESVGSLEKYTPDLLITFGLSIISKNLKLALRKMNIAAHWHVIAEGKAPDPFFSVTDTVNMPVEAFLSRFVDTVTEKPDNYRNTWKTLENSQVKKFNRFIRTKPFFELTAVKKVIENLPEGSTLHLGNSLPVRYANFHGIGNRNIKIFSNRGASGIDGCVSTFTGHAISTPDKVHTLIIGDLAFFYDRNGLWMKSIPENIRIIILNNHGGGIFRVIDGPDSIPERDKYFVTVQPRSAKLTVEETGLRYLHADTEADFSKGLGELYQGTGPGVLEFESDMDTNAELLKALRQI